MKYLTDEEKFQALKDRDPEAEGEFVYAVISTSIVCRPTCYSKLALSRNIKFYDNVNQALLHSYRPCKRCKPTVQSDWNNQRVFLAKACRLVYEAATCGARLDIDHIIKELNVSKWYFYRTFKTYLMTTPRKFYLKCLSEDLKDVKLPIIQTKRNVIKQRKMVDEMLSENDKFLQMVENEILC
ncbi:hypothetical protein CLIB1423_18S02344 [[Candida] railenensis]|uniref:Ada DNA repair metal-binding domain-containing protein n=1 Tax=[Candida] railenensis TaxID=45579 RepID=A0A9P0QSI9_9ASCO|nr:hypothetical protein CLIB1423_18S02344 [[Candida] railenensis]